MRNIISIYTSFSLFGGAEKVAIDIHEGLKNNFKSSIASFTKYEEINENYCIKKEEYIKLNFMNLLNLKNSMVLSHHRKMTSILIILNKLFFLNLQIIHIAHNEFFNLKYFTFFPENIVAVSNKVKYNLIKYFKVKSKIRVIYNGQKEVQIEKTNLDVNNINILYPARITSIKAQIQLVKNLKNLIHSNIKIIFAGDGPQLSELKLKIKDLPNFIAMGFVKDIKSLYLKCNYVLLFSKNEGLPLSLIEATKFYKPIICNDVGGNVEICENNKNGYIVNKYHELVLLLNSLSHISTNNYSKMCIESKNIFIKKFCYQNMIEDYLQLIKLIQ